jgi:hypothetical protein
LYRYTEAVGQERNLQIQQQQERNTGYYNRGSMGGVANIPALGGGRSFGGAFGGPKDDDAGSSSDEETYRGISFDQIKVYRSLEDQGAFRTPGSQLDWDLPSGDDRETRAARLAITRDALSRAHHDPAHMKAFREHMQHPALLPPRCRAGSSNDGSGNTGSDVMGTSAMTPVVANNSSHLLRSADSRRQAAAACEAAASANSAAGGENFGHRPGDEFLEGYCSATESPALSKGKFLDRIRSGDVKAMEEAQKEQMELEHLANENGLPVPLPLPYSAFGAGGAGGGVQVQAATSARGGVSPASYLMQFADRANQLSKMKAEHEATKDKAAAAAGDKTAGGGADKAAAAGGASSSADIYAAISNRLTSTEEPRTFYDAANAAAVEVGLYKLKCS